MPALAPPALARRRVPRTPVPAALAGTLPSYALYGEHGLRQATDWLHVESIAERSQLHGWEIQPHRHERLFQILVLAQGQAQAWLHGGVQALAGPAVLWLPAMVPHGFRFDPAVRGWVVTVLDNHLQQLLAAQPGLRSRLVDAPVQVRALGARPAVPGVVPDVVLGALSGVLSEAMPEAASEAASEAVPEAVPEGVSDEVPEAAPCAVAEAMASLIAEAGVQGDWRDVALDAALLRLLVALARLPAAAPALAAPGVTGAAGAAKAAPAAGRPRAAPGARAEAHVQRFRGLVDQHFRAQPALAGLAAALGITPTQLNRVCQQVLGQSALAVLHGRLLLEAQRELAYSGLGVKQIALGLGFADAGYFTRFFQRHCGCTPSAWRARCAAR